MVDRCRADLSASVNRLTEYSDACGTRLRPNRFTNSGAADSGAARLQVTSVGGLGNRLRILLSGLALAQAKGLGPVFETARMYRGPAPAGRREARFGEATLELG